MEKYNSNIKLGTVTLNVVNLEKQIKFYTESMGMELISNYAQGATLGTKDKTPLLFLNKVEGTLVHSYGLYHIAYLVPSKQDLANILRHFIDTHTPLECGADHGYSNALYLTDIEGNGIEVYYDKDESTWDKREDGKIVGITEQLDADHLLSISEKVIPYTLPVGTTIGHIHLSVKNSSESTSFYQKVLGFKDKFTVPSASWIAYGDYHHHLAVNQWTGPNLNLRQKGTPGLAYFEIIFVNNATYTNIINNIKENNINIVQKLANKTIITDPNGIEVHLVNQSN